MARARNIKPSIFTNEVLGTLDPIISMTFIGLWCLADRTGKLEDRPLRIKAELFPYREGLDVNGYLTVLERLGFIARYEVDGKRYIQVLNFEKHQAPHHTEKAKGYPEKPASNGHSGDLTVKQPFADGEQKVPERSDSLIPDSLIPDSLIPDSLIQQSPAKRAPPSLAIARPDDVTEQTWSDWLQHRKTKKAPVTQTVLNGAIGEASKAGMSLEDFLQVWCRRGSQGLEASWLRPDERSTAKQPQQKTFAERDREAGWLRWEEQTGRPHPDRQKAQGHVIDVTPRNLEIEQ